MALIGAWLTAITTLLLLVTLTGVSLELYWVSLIMLQQ